MAMETILDRSGVHYNPVYGTPEEDKELERSYKHLCDLRDEVIAMGIIPPVSEWNKLNKKYRINSVVEPVESCYKNSGFLREAAILSLYYTGTGKSTSEVKYVGVYMLPIHNDFQLFHFIGISIS